MTIAIYPGSFDPITNGHLEVILQASKIFDTVIVAVANNINKKGFYPVEKRVELIKRCVSNFKNVKVDSFDGLTVKYAQKNNANVIIRGVRNSVDFEYELQMFNVNRDLDDSIQTVFIPSTSKNIHISSSVVRELITLGVDISEYVPINVIDEI